MRGRRSKISLEVYARLHYTGVREKDRPVIDDLLYNANKLAKASHSDA